MNLSQEPVEIGVVVYQGREIEVAVVNYLSGCLPHSGHGEDMEGDEEGDEEILRDSDGHFYLRRTLWLCQTRVHRISAKAAILWAVVRLNWVRSDLRDKARTLIAGKGAA